MKLFGFKPAARVEPRPPLGLGIGPGWTGGDWPRSYEAQVRAGYCDNAVAQRAVRLVWADGNILRGNAGDWKVMTGFRLHTGDPD